MCEKLRIGFTGFNKMLRAIQNFTWRCDGGVRLRCFAEVLREQRFRHRNEWVAERASRREAMLLKRSLPLFDEPFDKVVTLV
jgi:hypothetical protein